MGLVQWVTREPHDVAQLFASRRDMSTSDPHMRRARTLARVLDTAIGVPGTPIRIGLDAILGLVPGAGDVIGAVLSGYIVLIALRNGAPSVVIWRMLGNIGIDTLVGSVPVIGDLFDVAYKSNMKNVELMERYALRPETVTKRSRWMAALVIAVIALALVGIATVGVLAARLLWRMLTT